MKKELYIDEIFLDHLEKNQVQRKPLSVECLLMIFEKLLKENNHMIHLRDMYDIS